jgi:aerobic-type carbon monoxide dehydrogenase small subunit (CoxS/CutS family)
MFEAIRFKLNGKPTQLTVDGERRLLWVLRSDFGLAGTKYGCGEGFCGACTVLVNNKATRSCQVPDE